MNDSRLPNFEEMGFATLDLEREKRQGFAEVVYCAGKTEEQNLSILKKLAENHDQV